MNIENKYSYLVRKTQKALGVFQKIRDELQSLSVSCDDEIAKCHTQKAEYDQLIEETQKLKAQEDEAIIFLKQQQDRARSTSEKIAALFQ